MATVYEIPMNFVDPNADIILCSSDNIDFQVYRTILSKSSPVFEHMFQSPKPLTMSDRELKNDVQVVQMTESAEVIGALLQLCYPMDDPEIQPLHKLKPVLEALVKYELDKFRSGWINRMMELAVERDPLGVYAVALNLGRISCHYKMEDAVRLAARLTLRHPAPYGPSTPELASMSGLDFHRLLEYRCRCSAHLATRLLLREAPRVLVSSCIRYQGKCVRQDVKSGYYPKWFVDYYETLSASVKDNPWGEIVKADKFRIDTLRLLINNCPSCAAAFATENVEFTNQLSADIEAAVAEIPLCMD